MESLPLSLIIITGLIIIVTIQIVLLLRRPSENSGQWAMLTERLNRFDELMQQINETNVNIRDVKESNQKICSELAETKGRIASFGEAQGNSNETILALQNSLPLELAKGINTLTEAMSSAQTAFRNEVSTTLKSNTESLDKKVGEVRQITDTKLGEIVTRSTESAKSLNETAQKTITTVADKLNELKTTVDKALKEELGNMRTENGAKLEAMRLTVDEKLHATLEQRLGESFKLVSDRLEQVHKGLGEMQTLAAGVGDLKKVLTNVKTRGTWGEVQLEALLDQIMTPEQYGKNIATKPGSNSRVEFAIRLPGRTDDGSPVWLPIDAKFPMEDYQRLVDAQERADLPAIEEAGKALENRIKAEAKVIRDKYIDPPHTTDFGILYLPTEGLYAEVLRRPGLADTVQRDSKINVAGPTTLAAMLNSLQMGFRTLAIEKRSSEVWTVLGAVKTEFGKFGEALAHTKKKLEEAHNSIDNTEKRNRVLTRKLSGVDAMPEHEAELILAGTASRLDADEPQIID